MEGSIPWETAGIHAANAGSEWKRKPGGAGRGAYKPFEGSHPTSADGQDRSPKLKLYALLFSSIVDNTPEAKEVVKPAKVVPI